jgi:hypothetical protein
MKTIFQVQSDKVYCEHCAEVPATVHLKEASYCDDCFEATAQNELARLFGYVPCCAIRWNGEQPSLCLVESGTEHDHSPRSEQEQQNA